MDSPIHHQRRPTPLQWTALALLVLSVAINYADRGNLGVALSSIQEELHLTSREIGYLQTGFFFTYAFLQIPAGWVIDRWNVNWVFAAGFLIWSAATGFVGLAGAFSSIFALRLLLGTGECIAYPAYSKIIANFFPEDLRGAANGLIDVGCKIGPALGVTVGFKMLNAYGWRDMFVLVGFISLLWLIPWGIVAARLPANPSAQYHPEQPVWTPSYPQILTQRKFWGTSIGLFGGNYAWYFFLTWLPYYFEKERHYAKHDLSLTASLPFWAVAFSALACGFLGDAFVRRGYEPGRVRQTFLCAGLLTCGALMLPSVAARNPAVSNGLLMLAAVAMGAWSSNHWALTQRIAGPAAAGKWTAFQNCLGNTAGLIGAFITGRVLDAGYSFFTAFAIACAVLVVGVSGYWIVIGSPSPITWRQPIHETVTSVV